ncbi:MAG: sodium:proton antiporter [Acidobacteriota bacterium]
MHEILDTIVIASFLGILAQVLAERFKLPAILPLLLLGMAAGPMGFHLFDPKALGHGLEVFIHLGVAVILFEGGLSLDPKELRKVGAPVRNLLTLGVVVTGVGGAWVAQAITGMPWETAALFGAIVTVTGPTVIVPLLRHMICPSSIRAVLVSEGLIIDAIGAVLAYLVLQWIERAAEMGFQEIVGEVAVLAATGAALGFVAGSLAKFAARSRLLAGELRNLAILALLLACYMVAERLAPQSGILASVVMGFTLSASDVPDLASVKMFKGQLTVFLISILFILLSGQLDLSSMMQLGWKGVAVMVVMILLVRPLSVLVSVWPSHMDVRSRLVLALTAPRGIVAAAVASLSAIQLRQYGLEEGAVILEGLIYLLILVSGAWATMMALVLPRVLGFEKDPQRRRSILVGSTQLSRLLARRLAEAGRKVVVIDSVSEKLRMLKAAGIAVVRGDARNASTYEAAGIERDNDLLAMTPNDDLNVLCSEMVREEFGIEHPVVALNRPSKEFGRLRRAYIDLFGGEPFDLERWNRRIRHLEAQLVEVDLEIEGAKEAVLALFEDSDEEDGEKKDRPAVFLCGWHDDKPNFRRASIDLGRVERVTLLALAATADELRPYRVTESDPAVEGESGPAAEASGEPSPAPV